MERIFALYDSDSFYATRFMEYFKKRKEFNFEFAAFTRKESLEEYLTVHPIEIILLGSRELAGEIALPNVKYIYILTDRPKEDNPEGFPYVYKYQPAKALMADIMNDYHRKENLVQVNNNPGQVKIVSVVSPIPGAEAINFAWSISLLLAGQRKALLVMLDPLPVQTVVYADNNNPVLTEFIFYLKENSDCMLKMRSLLGYNGNLAYLCGISHALDILSLTREDISKWIREIKAHKDYSSIIFYLGIHNEAAAQLLDSSDQVLITDTGSSYEEAVYAVWSHQMDRSGMNVNHEKYQRIRLQKEVFGQVPLSEAEIMNTSTWDIAKQHVKRLG